MGSGLLHCSLIALIVSLSAAPSASASTVLGVGAEGRIVAGQGLIRVGAPAGAVVDAVNVATGDEVKAGQVIALLRGYDTSAATVATAEAEMARAEAERTLHLRRSALRSLEHQQKIDELRGQETDLQSVLDEKSPPRRESEEIQFQLKGVRRQLDLARAAQGPLEQEILAGNEAAAAQVAAAQAALVEAQVSRQAYQVKAPVDGQIVDVVTLPGETIQPNGIVLLVPDAPIRIVAEVYVNDIVRVKPGQTATASGPGLEGTLNGKVERINRQVSPSNLFDPDPRVFTDRRVVAVWIELDEASQAKASQFINGQVKVRIMP